MDLVSNFVGSISPNMFGGNNQSVTSNVDLQDKTFADMLEEQINKEMEQDKTGFADRLGLPGGIYIGDFDGLRPSFDLKAETAEQIKPVNEFENADFLNYKDIKDMSSSEVLTFFKSIFDNKPSITDTSNSSLFEFERKTAANQYNKYSKSVVTDLSEFVSDALNLG